MFCARVAMEVVEGASVSTGSRPTTRLGRAARVELTSTTGMFKRLATRRGAGDRTQTRDDGFARVKKHSGICLGRLLHRSKLRDYRTKGSTDMAAAMSAPATGLCASGSGGGGFIVTLAVRDHHAVREMYSCASPASLFFKWLGAQSPSPRN